MIKSTATLAFRALFGAAVIWLIMGFLLRVSGIRDRYDGWALAYYTTPWAVLTLGFGAAFVAARTRRFARLASVGFLVASAGGWVRSARVDQTPLPDSPADIRILLWNVSNNDAALDQIAGRIRLSSPDLVGLAEAGNHFSNIERWAAEFPNYHVARLPGQMLCMGKQALNLKEKGSLGNGSWYALNSTILEGREVWILQADINARPLRSRGPALRRLAEKVHVYRDRPLILMGDFNLPRESHHLDFLRFTFQHAFAARGRGYAETWPIPFPVLSLDQIWLSEQFDVVRCDHGWSRHTDHRSVNAVVRIR